MNRTAKFAALLSAFGIKLPEAKAKEIKSGRRLGFGLSWNPLSKDDYFTTSRGYIMRRQEKRDKTMSARQYRRKRIAVHQSFQQPDPPAERNIGPKRRRRLMRHILNNDWRSFKGNTNDKRARGTR